MKRTKAFGCDSSWVVFILVILGAFAACPSTTQAQCTTHSEGNNAVTASCGTQGSAAYIDASVFGTTDVCARINAVLKLSTYPPAGAVIDARGVNPGTSQSCSVNPWSGTTDPPSTILLPAGTITIKSAWTLPGSTRIIGEGPGLTTITGSGVSTSLILMGSSTLCPSPTYCSGISVEELTLNGGGSAVKGASNSSAQTGSYVRRVNITNLSATGVGLEVNTVGAADSGPYTDITFSLGSTAASSQACVQILNATTKGIHGLTCVGSTSSPPAAAVELDASNNSVEDVQITGFVDGIRLGESGAAESDVIFNVTGGTGVTNVVHLTTGFTVAQVSIMAVTTGGATNSIADDVSSSGSPLTDSSVALYALGKAVTIGGDAAHSRFTTSPNRATWAVGSKSIAGNACTENGSLYSNTGGGTGDTWYVCKNLVWTDID